MNFDMFWQHKQTFRLQLLNACIISKTNKPPNFFVMYRLPFDQNWRLNVDHIKPEVFREHRPPPNANLLNDFCNAKMQLWSESTRYFFDNPVNPDFGFRTPGSGRWSGSSPKFNHLVSVPCPTLQEISWKSVHKFFSYSTDRQTD